MIPSDASKMPLEDLYQEVILDHNRNPRNFKVLDPCSCESRGVNPLCGDEVHLYLSIQDGKIVDIGFQGKGCAISKSSASMMTSNVKGRPLDEVLALKELFVNLIKNDIVRDDLRDRLGNLKIFEGVKKFPIRVKCATMVWHTLADAIKKGNL